MTRLLLLVLLFLTQKLYAAESYVRESVVFSGHANHLKGGDLNEVNIGLGYERWYSTKLFVGTGIVLNSHERLTLYVGIGYTPLVVNRFKLGGVIGLGTGYDHIIDITGGIYSELRLTQRWYLNSTYFPVDGGVLFFQAKRDF